MRDLLVERHDGLETWLINRPRARNALGRALVAELKEGLERIRHDRALRVVILSGGPGIFCAGADLKERRSMSEPEVRQFLSDLRQICRGIEQSERLFVAAIDGAALGGGLELALACDLRVASPTARMGLTETSLGIIPGAGGTQRLPRLIGAGRAKELILTARLVGGDEALALGLVERLASKGGALEEAKRLAAALCRNGPLALVSAKRAIDDGQGLSLEEALRVEMRQYERVLSSRDRLEGLAAFAERRAATFSGE